jgi:cob(I)alamin adenosyltransferase
MKIYTRTGDTGLTGLIGGDRVAKHDARLDAYGTVDELNAAVGLAAIPAGDAVRQKLASIQNELFVIGSHLAAPADSETATKHLPAIDPAAVARLETEIDAAEAALPPLKNFVLPGGTEPAARLHLARTVCRRAERLVTAFAQQEAVHAAIVPYLNRLSDWLFVQARLANHEAGVADVPWVPAK